MAFDYKKEYREYYLPPKKPGIVEIPAMNFAAVRGAGDPNEEGGAYKRAIGLLYGVAFTLKMSEKAGHKIEGYFPYVVPPLEGLWWQEGVCGVDYTRKEKFQWISMIRLPDFVDKKAFDWAVEEASRKKQADFSAVEFFTWREGLCVQCMHIGPYDTEPETVEKIERFIAEQGFRSDFSDNRYHHEIYLGDPRRAAPGKLKTVLRHPIRKA